jgi:hypothetical protein
LISNQWFQNLHETETRTRLTETFLCYKFQVPRGFPGTFKTWVRHVLKRCRNIFLSFYKIISFLRRIVYRWIEHDLINQTIMTFSIIFYGF